ncbi:sensor histidine kinase [Sphingosinicella rhizophila]|uniref:histidine kinase n=1 Tax=Sphingosinicella rhizophila TaxID=3050082 RepID=A0ABU3Q417_9SPHN|nr:ATP-binding protein [Sphingosinicella sp. GR2756]MDT9598160.1 ATP-binding protein [Sphingosinicella sp. GR2756]
MRIQSHRWSGSILGHTLLLVMGIVIVMAGLSVATILFRSAPTNPAISIQEIADLLNGKPAPRPINRIKVTIAAEPPALPAGVEDPFSLVQRSALAQHMGVPIDRIRFLRVLPSGPRVEYQRLLIISPKGGEQISSIGQRLNLLILGSFTAALQLPDGRWRTVTREGPDALQRWKFTTIGWILLTILLVFPLAWLFSNRIAKPIRAFSKAAERLGRDRQIEAVAVTGPREIRLAATALNDMQRSLQRYVKERTAMIGAIAHDLRTPLSRLEFLLASVPEETRRKAEAEIAEMEKMIANTLEFVENETRAQQPEEVDLRLLVESVADDLADTGHDVRLVEAGNATVRADPLMLRRLFSNLVMNAVTYGKNARISLSVDHRTAIVDICDTGPGLAEEDLERVFEPFYRTEGSRNRSTGGIGLGLSIVKAAVQASGGDISLSNRPEGGLCARVRLPISGG